MHRLRAVRRDLHVSWPRRPPRKARRGLEARQGVRVLSGEVHLGRRMHRRVPDKVHLLDEADDLHRRTARAPPQERSLREGLGRGRSPLGARLVLFYSNLGEGDPAHAPGAPGKVGHLFIVTCGL